MPPHLKSMNQALLENGTYEHIMSYLEKKFELNGLEAPNELQKNTVTQQATQQNAEKPKPTCHHCKKPGHYRIQCRQLKLQREQAQNNTSRSGNKNNSNNGGQTNSTSNIKISNDNKTNNTNNRNDRKPKPVYPTCDTSGKFSFTTEKCYLGVNAAKRPPPRN